MRKFFLILWFEYRRQVFTWRFFFNMFILPQLSVVGTGVMFGILLLTINRQPVGYVDQAGLIPPARVEQGQVVDRLLSLFEVQYIPYAREAQARVALDTGKIQAYYVLPPDFRQTRSARLIYSNSPSATARAQFDMLLRRSLLADLPEQRLSRLLGTSITLVISLPQNSQERYGPVPLRIFLPVLVGFGLYTSSLACARFLCRVLIEEKAGRVAEILVTSVSSKKLILAKVAAQIGVGLTEMGGLVALPSLALGVVAVAGLSVSKVLPFDLLTLVLLALICLLTFLLLAVLVTLLSVLAKTASDAENSYLPIILLMIFTPMCALGILATQPNHWLTYLLSFFPLTSAYALLCRLAMTTVPTWQMALVSLVLLLTSLALLWLTGRIFQSGMLLDGEHLRPRHLARIILKGTE